MHTSHKVERNNATTPTEGEMAFFVRIYLVIKVILFKIMFEARKQILNFKLKIECFVNLLHTVCRFFKGKIAFECLFGSQEKIFKQYSSV